MGKWHLGFCKQAYTPTHRGFDRWSQEDDGQERLLPLLSFYGYYTGAEHYFSHLRDKGFDFRRNNTVDFSARGKYSTDLFTAEAVRIVKTHDAKNPLFLYLPYQVQRNFNTFSSYILS